MSHTLQYVYSLLSHGDSHYFLGDYPTACSYYELAGLHTEESNKALSIEIFLRLGKVHHRIGCCEQAIIIFHQALTLCRSLELPALDVHLHQSLCEVYEQQEQYDKALEHYKQYDAILDTVSIREKQDVLRDVQNRFNTAQLEHEREVAKLKNGDLAEALAIVEKLHQQLLSLNNEKNKVLGIVAADLKQPLEEIYSYIQSLQTDESHTAETIAFTAKQIGILADSVYGLIRHLLESQDEEA